ncbi:HAMP domain-containing sensor histidine kinase [Robertmurraya sp. DFI.2.37]|uniref:sensor histidine kinase n=1 Tax=Robertmurraya sp. DFI.2.37 TaxID=3031819 RepID=UPI0012486DD2|nr:HAMP domain-containing sensor histidine kinase [Robertmurraya sp. DFI.2.37]MDF1507315.1 HAMP domain-containing sensor histidine kinase [Robertmurraya sp. DFI.2.37]
MKKIRIRKFTVLCFALILTLPWLFYVAAHFLVTSTLTFRFDDAQLEQIEAAVDMIEENVDMWTVPSWQEQLSEQVEASQLDVSIWSGSGQLVFHTGTERERAFLRTEQFSILEEGKVLGRVAISQTDSRTVQIIAAFVGLLTAFMLVGVLLRKYILKPLESMSKGARKIAEGDLDVQLPTSRIAEIREVHEGFNVMVRGLKDSFQKQMEFEDERRFMLAALAHDLRTPLFALRGYLDGLERGIADTTEKRAKYLAVCKEKSAQLDQLVEELFAFSKSEYHDVKLNKKEFDFNQLLQRAINSVALQAQNKSISFDLAHLEETCFVKADAHLLERALNNLLENAVRYSPMDGKIIVTCEKDNANLIFTIQDTGGGFTSDDLARAFEPFYRGEASRNRATGGTGLGLAIARRIMRQHDGDLVAANCESGGAIIRGWLPLND